MLTTLAMKRFPRGGASSSSSSSGVDTDVVIDRVFGSDVDLENRESVIALLARLGAEESDTATTAAAQPSTLSAPLAAANALASDKTLATAFARTSTASSDGSSLVEIVQNEIGALVRELQAPDPNQNKVEALFRQLTGSARPTGVLDPADVEGTLGQVRDHCQLDTADPWSSRVAEAKTRFAVMVAGVATLAQTFRTIDQTSGPASLAAKTDTVRRCLAGATLALIELRTAVPDSAWLVETVRTTPPLVASKLFEWVYELVTEQAPRLLPLGRNGIVSIANTASLCSTELKKAFLTATKPASLCPAIPTSFDTPAVKNAVNKVLCQFEIINDVAAQMTPAPAPVCTSAKLVAKDSTNVLAHAQKGTDVDLLIYGSDLKPSTEAVVTRNGKKIASIKPFAPPAKGYAKYRFKPKDAGCYQFQVGSIISDFLITD